MTIEIKVLNNAALTNEEIYRELITLETKLNSTSKLRFHIDGDSFYMPTETDKPDTGIEVFGYNEAWKDEDFNPEGVSVCFLTDEGFWYVAYWCNQHDEWHTRPTGEEQWDKEKYESFLPPPTHWKKKIAPL